MKSLSVILLLLLGSSTALNAQTQNVSCNCCDEVYRQFDFWVGEWEVKDTSGKLLGHNTIQLIEDSCALRENWKGASGFSGTSISFYNKNTKQWHQTWVDHKGGSILMDGGLHKESMVLLSPPIERNGKVVLNRTKWTPIPEGVLHTWNQSTDGGATWQVVFMGIYTPVEGSH